MLQIYWWKIGETKSAGKLTEQLEKETQSKSIHTCFGDESIKIFNELLIRFIYGKWTKELLPNILF